MSCVIHNQIWSRQSYNRIHEIQCIRPSFHKLHSKLYFILTNKNKMNSCFSLSDAEKNEEDGVIYESYKQYIKPFDLVMFKGKNLFSDMIRFVEKTKSRHILKETSEYKISADSFSHVGMVVSSEILGDPRLVPGKLYIWESTMSGGLGDGVDNVSGKSYLGVQLRDLDAVVSSYNCKSGGRVAFCSMKDGISVRYDNEEKLALFKQRFTDLFIMYNGILYDANFYTLTSSMFKCMRPGRDKIENFFNTTDWLFCSELITIIYKNLGFFPHSVDPKNVVPMDFVGYEVDTPENGGIPVIVKKPVYITYSKSDQEVITTKM